MPKRTDIKKILIIGSGPIIISQACEFDYSGTQACKALQGRRLRGGADQLQPRHHHDRPGDGRPHLHRAHHPGDGLPGHRAGAPRCPAPHPGRPDRPQLRHCRGRHRHPGELRGGDDRGQPRGHQKGRRPGTLPGRHGQHQPPGAQERHRPHPGGGRGRGPGDRLSRHRAPQLHPGRHRRRHRLQPGGPASSCPPRAWTPA